MSNPKTRSNYVVPFCIKRVKTGPDKCVGEWCADCVGFSKYRMVGVKKHIQDHPYRQRPQLWENEG